MGISAGERSPGKMRSLPVNIRHSPKRAVGVCRAADVSRDWRDYRLYRWLFPRKNGYRSDANRRRDAIIPGIRHDLGVNWHTGRWS
ncbi:hypothetical protein D3C80_1588420 [compost metagenome]